VLWIWDNVEPVAGFPKGSESSWSAQEQHELADFLRAARETKAKFLLTSRRDERDWLGDLPARIAVLPMLFPERMELTRALAAKRGRRLRDVEDWRPLLEFTQGNPLEITVVVGQALRDGLHTREQVEEFVARLRAGEPAFEDEETLGRTRSLAASLNYGFELAFNELERKQLAVLHLFQGFVQVTALQLMAVVTTRDAGIQLLDRAAEIGQLTALGGGLYSIHPAVSWFFHQLFEQYDVESRERALRAYVEAMASLGSYYHDGYLGGTRYLIRALIAEEPNLLYARALARQHCWWPEVVRAMHGLRVLYYHTGRRAEWARLVEEIVPDFVEPVSGDPSAGREEQWSQIIGYRVQLAREARNWDEAEGLQLRSVEWNRSRVREEDRDSIRVLVASLHEFGDIQREMLRAECVETYRECFNRALGIEYRSGAATVALKLGHAYVRIPALRNLDTAERWYCRSLELIPDGDHLSRAGCLGEPGSVAFKRYEEACAAKKPEAEILRHLNDAFRRYREALKMTPPDAVRQLALAHQHLGIIYAAVGDLARSLHHYRESIRLSEAGADAYTAAQTRGNVAVALTNAGRLADARQYAEAALRGFQTYGASAAEDIQKTLDLIAAIAKAATA